MKFNELDLNASETVTVGFLRNTIQKCSEEDHVQQVAYTTYHDGLTQICFSCGAVRTTIPEGDLQ
jgi:hypothetical protein